MRVPSISAALLLSAGLSLSGCESLSLPFSQTAAPAQPPASSAKPRSEPEPPAYRTAETLPAATDLNWEPSLALPRDQLEARLVELQENGSPQEAINEVLSAIAYLYDAELYLLFKDTLDYLPAKAQQHEVEVQNRWLDQRQQAMTQAFLVDPDGEVARYAAGQTFIAETRRRIEELHQLRKLIVIE